MADFDFDAVVRWARFDPRKTLARRADAQLPFVGEESLAGGALLLDTCVYIDQLQGRSPSVVNGVVTARQVNHSTVALQELMHTVGVLDPDDRRTSTAIAAIRTLIRSMQPHRIVVPDSDILGRAALLAGMLCRLQGYGVDRKLRALADCVVFLQAQKLGLTVLSANIGDFDWLLQLVPSGRVLFYRRLQS
ncbi:MAG: DNA-binding protein [Alphaproteobacteria bacterium]|nr:MAG: DNA-binding protein [Alphaproteobacteria bacterium]